MIPTNSLQDENYVAKETSQMTTTYNLDGTIDQETCTKDNIVVECKTLNTYDELVQETSNIMESQITHYEVIETMNKSKFFTTCTSSSYGDIPCEQAVMYDELVSKIDKENE